MVSTLEKMKLINSPFLRSDLPAFKAGDVVKMKLRVKEADKIRLHPFEGTVIRVTGGGINASFTVRKVSFGEGVEKVFPLHSPVIDSLQVVSKGKTNRAKLYYLRTRVGKAAKVKKIEEKQTVSTAA
ncbi:MAG: 50S ribosomal protein L19 [Candidatus Omnitrophica bacterium]|nr:50S ribosomal protein L19 [Candidatus Omnitrophota bacterium]